MSVNSRRPSAWKLKNKAWAGAAVIGFIVCFALKMPMIGAYVGLTLMSKGIPSGDDLLNVYGYESNKPARAVKLGLIKDTQAKLGFKKDTFAMMMLWLGYGNPGQQVWEEGPCTPVAHPTKPLRISSVANTLAAISMSWLITLTPIHALLLERITPKWGWWYEIPLFLLNTLFAYATLQIMAHAARALHSNKHDDNMSLVQVGIDLGTIPPPVHYQKELLYQIEPGPDGGLPQPDHLIGHPHEGYLSRILYHAHVQEYQPLDRNEWIKIGLKAVFVATSLMATAWFITTPLLTLLLLPPVLLLAAIYPMEQQRKHTMDVIGTQYKYEIAEASNWSTAWQEMPAIKGTPPAMAFEDNVPEDNPTHKVITFSVGALEAGVSPLQDEKVAKGLMTHLRTDTILITPYKRIVEGVGHEHGSAQEQNFKLSYPLNNSSQMLTGIAGPLDISSPGTLGTQYHLTPEADVTTRTFYAEAGFQAAFRTLKLPQPIFVKHQILTALKSARNKDSVDSPNQIYSMEYNLEDTGLTYQKLLQQTQELQEELGTSWLRVGRRVNAALRNVNDPFKPSRFITIVYSLTGKNPVTNETHFSRDKEQGFVEGLEWNWQMIKLGLPELLFKQQDTMRATPPRGLTSNGSPTPRHKRTNPRENPRRRNDRRPNRRDEKKSSSAKNNTLDTQNVIRRITWILPEGVQYSTIAKQTESIREKMGVQWLRISDPTVDYNEPSTSNTITFTYGPDPTKETPDNPINLSLKDQNQIQQLNWTHTLRTLNWKYFGMRLENTIDHSKKQDRSLLETVWHLPEGLTYIDILKQRDRMAEKFGTEFFEIYRRSSVPKNSTWVDESYVSIVFGNDPGDPKVVGADMTYPNVNDQTAKYIDNVLWGTSFNKVGLVDTDGTTPVVISNIEKPLGVVITTFHKVGKLSEDDFDKVIPGLKTSLGINHIKVDYTESAKTFSIEHAAEDPLANNFDYDDYKHKLLMSEPPKPGHGKIEFGMGIGSNGEIVVMDFEGSPHICIGASSGSGKSYLLRAILLTWMYNNDPDKDLWLMMIEPKKGLEGYAVYPHVKAFIGNDTPQYQQIPELTDENTGQQSVKPLIVGAFDIYDWLVKEMERREAIYKRYEAEWDVRIEKLPEARAAAMQHMEENGLDDHELFLPFICLVAEEAPQFMRELKSSASVSKAESGMVTDVRRIGEAVSQRARATGIILMNVSQNFKNELFPIEIRGNSRVIGLTTNTQRSSINIWGDDELWKLGVPGRGIKADPDTGELVDFRAFYVPMGEIEEKNGEKVQLRNYFAENLGHLELRSEALNGWSEQATNLHKPKYAVVSDQSVTTRGIPEPSDLVTGGFTDEF